MEVPPLVAQLIRRVRSIHVSDNCCDPCKYTREICTQIEEYYASQQEPKKEQEKGNEK